MNKLRMFATGFVLVIMALFLFSFLQAMFSAVKEAKEISYKTFRDKIKAGELERVAITQDRILGNFRAHPDASGTTSPAARLSQGNEDENRSRFQVIKLDDPQLIPDLQDAGVDYSGRVESHFIRNVLLYGALPIGAVLLLWMFFSFRRMGMGPPNQALNFEKSKAKIYELDSQNKVTFSDIAGVDEAVEEVKEVVDFLKNPEKYASLGGKLPKGILLVGPPGTGKTHLARAVACEAGVPFFNLSGSDFVEMFVGVGAARVRDLFTEAKKHVPCIIFIDELDAIGKRRTDTGGNEEQENTLNQLLMEINGFEPGLGVILMAATNRPDVLDPALIRPGRFDRQVLVDRPDLNGRIAIFGVHTKNLKLATDVNLRRLAAQTPGFAGAEIANVTNEAALLASRKNEREITLRDFEDAIERVVAGLEKKNKLINEHERTIIAHHESGHAIVGYFTPGADEVQKVSIVPRGLSALGYTRQAPLDDRYLMSKTELLGKIKSLLGGRAAEDIVFGDVSTGASDDLEKVAKIAIDMVTVYGMSERLQNLSFVHHQNPGFLGEEASLYHISEKLEQTVDDVIIEIIQECYRETKQLLIDKRGQLDQMAHALLEKEALEHKEIEALLGKRVQPAKGPNLVKA